MRRSVLRGSEVLITPHLLTQTDARSGIERKEYEGVWYEILSNTLVNEPIRVEFLC